MQRNSQTAERWAEGDFDPHALIHAGRALFADQQQTIAALPLFDIHQDPEEWSVSATQVLFEKAASGTGPSPAALRHPFYRLPAEQRLILAALYLCRWSYSRISKTLLTPVPEIEKWATQARNHFSAAASQLGQPAIPLPTPAQNLGPRCPEFDAESPWAYRFLDHEISQSQKIFLERHLMTCVSCANHLERMRKIYFAIAGLFPEPLQNADDIDRETEVLRLAVNRRTRQILDKGSWKESVWAWWARRDVKLALVFLGLVFFWSLTGR